MFSVKGGFSGQDRQVYRMPLRPSFHWAARPKKEGLACAAGRRDRALSIRCFCHPNSKGVWKYPYSTHIHFSLTQAFYRHGKSRENIDYRE
jgi:hypothetical protein